MKTYILEHHYLAGEIDTYYFRSSRPLAELTDEILAEGLSIIFEPDKGEELTVEELVVGELPTI